MHSAYTMSLPCEIRMRMGITSPGNPVDVDADNDAINVDLRQMDDVSRGKKRKKAFLGRTFTALYRL